MNTSRARSTAVANFEAARQTLISAKANYAAARKMLRQICPDAFAAVKSANVRAVVIGAPGVRARRRAVLARILQNAWDSKFSDDDNIYRALDQAISLGIYASSTTDAYWPIRRVAEELGLMRRQ